MTEVRKNVLAVLRIAETADSWSFNDKAIYDDYDLTDEDEWKAYVKQQGIRALFRLNRPYYSCNKRTEQETIQFNEVQLRSGKVITAVISWIEKNHQTGSIHLQTASCSRVFGCY